MSTITVPVQGMTCGHCVSSVTEELSEIDGVTAVAVDLNPGGTSHVTISAASELDDATIDQAVTEAGYVIAKA
ncbi:copper chaperone CopZ [Microbacterium endophyticum]|uniref:Copper chaperone CopZ n=1 Tax=Microbacterium endophyticum TaxID=1526412 RepID=A0A7W4YND8_9MICO|nr:cation transporter [Microbacterium endophyticum]MBB2975581.1 copper chaperone CopZ [Microbacterium endophyticum]NIK35400.1 copper chaperone CopZ [Microbacterium endophyticum]